MHGVRDGIDERGGTGHCRELHRGGGPEDFLAPGEVQDDLVGVNVDEFGTLAGFGASQVHTWQVGPPEEFGCRRAVACTGTSEVILSRLLAGVALMHGKVPGFGGRQGAALRSRLSGGPGGSFCIQRVLVACRSSGPGGDRLDGRRRRLLCAVRCLRVGRRAADHGCRVAGPVPGGARIQARSDAADHDGNRTVPEPVHHRCPGGGAGRARPGSPMPGSPMWT